MGFSEIFAIFAQKSSHISSQYFVVIFQDSSKNEEEANNYGDISVGEGVTPVSRYISM